MKVILSIASSDSSGGAGIQADIKTAEHFGVFSTTAITAITAQNTMGVKDIVELSGNIIYSQIQCILEDFEISAVKIGMLYSPDIIDVIQQILRKVSCPVVLDPIFISKTGSPLLKEDVIKSLSALFPHVSLLVPNVFEATNLFGKKLNIEAPCPVLVKNISSSNKKSVDRLFYSNSITKDFSGKFIDSTRLHGTGCSFSTAIASNLALGYELEKSIEISKKFIENAILQAPQIGKGTNGPINHNIKEEIQEED